MFTDMVGYTALGQKNESLSLALVEEQRKIIRPILARHNGREVKTIGDAFLVELPNAVDAVRCAYDIQRAVREFNFSLSPEKRIHLRIGVHVGEVLESQGDISGDAVNLASRIESLAEDGGVCVTSQVYELVKKKVDITLSDLGPKSLKNVEEPIDVYGMVMPWEKETAPAPPRFTKSRIAVLPFANMSPDPNDEYFADGMTEELITSLSGLNEITVIGRTSVMRYKDSKKSLAEIGRELSAGSLVEGSVRKASNRLRITIQLVDSQSEGHIWAQKYDRQLDDIFAIQAEIAESVTKELKIRLLESEKNRIQKRPTESTEAYMLYMKGRHYWNERSEGSVRKAIEYLERSVEIDKQFGLAYSGLADCYLVMGYNRQAEFLPSFEKAKAYSEKAIHLDASLAEAHTVLAAATHNLEFEYVKSEPEMKRAIELNPNYPTAHQWYAQFLWFRRRFVEAEAEIRTAVELDPFSLIINVNLGDIFRLQEKLDLAIEQYKKVVQMDPNFYPAHLGLLQAYLLKKNRAAAFQEVEALAATSNDPMGGKLGRALVYASMGETKEAKELLEQVVGEYESGQPSPYDVATVHFLLGENGKGFDWLGRAYEVHDSGLNGLLTDPEIRGVSNDPRLLALARKLNLL